MTRQILTNQFLADPDEPLLSLRSFLAGLAECGELRQVHGADWDLELGAIAQLSYRTARPKALLFDDIKGYPHGQRVLTGSTGSHRRLSRTLRLDAAPGNVDELGAASGSSELVDALRGRLSRWTVDAPNYPVLPVDNAPLLANTVPADKVDLLAFPVPRWHEHDGGRVIGTGCFVVTSDPETGRHNGGCYRMEVQPDGRTATISVIPGKHGAQNIARWFERHGRAPVTVSFGHDPLLVVAGGATEVPHNVSELEFAGAVAGGRVPVVMGPDTGLPIPAASELAVEGWLRPDLLGEDGPFAEWTGYRSRSRRPCLAIEISRLYHRDDPIQLGMPPGRPPHDYSYLWAVLKSAMIRDELAGAKVPGVKAVWAHEAGGGRLFVAVAIEQQYAGHSRQVADLVARCPAAGRRNRWVIVVDDDIDPVSLDQVVWAMSTRADPSLDVGFTRLGRGRAPDPVLTAGLPAVGSQAIIDACRPYDRRNTFPPVAQSDPEYLRLVHGRWRNTIDE